MKNIQNNDVPDSVSSWTSSDRKKKKSSVEKLYIQKQISSSSL